MAGTRSALRSWMFTRERSRNSMATPEIETSVRAVIDRANDATLPPVFVMNTYSTGIGIARNLHGRGVDVYGLSSEADAPGVRSRFFKGIYPVPNGRDEPRALCE